MYRHLSFHWTARIACVGAIFAATAGAVLAESDDAAKCALGAREGDFQACVRAIAHDPTDLASRRNLALAYLSINSYEECDRTHREIIALTPDDPRAHYDYAAALATFFEFSRAAEPIRVALRLAPDDLTIIRLAATIFEQAREYREAFAAMRIGAEHGEMLMMFDLAVYYQRGLGTPPNPEAARTWFERAAASGHVGAMEALARIFAEGRDGAPRDPTRSDYWSKRSKTEGIAPNEPEKTTY